MQIRTDHFGLKPGDPMDCDHCPRAWPRGDVRDVAARAGMPA